MTRQQGQTDPPLLLTREQAAAVAQVSEDRIDDWSHRPGFPVIRDGQLVRIHAAELDAWLRAEALKTNARPQPTLLETASGRKRRA